MNICGYYWLLLGIYGVSIDTQVIECTFVAENEASQEPET